MGHEIRQYLPDAKDFAYSDVVIAERRVVAMDVDPQRRLVYWTDSSLKTIKRAMIPEDPTQLGHPQDLRIPDIKDPAGLAVDWVAK